MKITDIQEIDGVLYANVKHGDVVIRFNTLSEILTDEPVYRISNYKESLKALLDFLTDYKCELQKCELQKTKVIQNPSPFTIQFDDDLNNVSVPSDYTIGFLFPTSDGWNVLYPINGTQAVLFPLPPGVSTEALAEYLKCNQDDLWWQSVQWKKIITITNKCYALLK
jgi:hypothetical protein